MLQKCRNGSNMNLFVLFGQTATGKTAKALELCNSENGEIVNFDSRQIYKKLDIVTGKDRPADSKYKIWLYDIVDPKEICSSADYVMRAEKVIADIIKRGKTPILVGGTGYYLRHLLFGIPEINIKEDWTLRKQLEEKTVLELQTILKEKGPTLLDAMNNSDRHNPRRLIRRIEVAHQGGLLPTPSTDITLGARIRDLVGRAIGPLNMKYLSFFHSSTDITKDKISQRVEQRITDGALEEVKNLLEEGYTKNNPGLNAIGYQQLIAYLHAEISLEEVKKEWITKEVQYAKRQKTYFQKYFPTKA